MKYPLLCIIAGAGLLLFPGQLLAQGKAEGISTEKQAVLNRVEELSGPFSKVAMQIWEWAEIGYQEYKSSGLLQEELRKAGFQVEAGVAEIPTAFVASYGSGKPVIAILGEFDALPGVSQTAAPQREERPGVKAGHACGHHLFGAGSAAAAIAVKEWLQKSGKSGTVRFYGTPAEEGGGGKVYMVRAGLFGDADAVLHWHPSSENRASPSSSLANISTKFRFYGQASHASAAPERGRSALDAVEAMNYMVNLMREHVPQNTRIHYVITRGGEAPNVVPAFAEVYYYARHPEMREVKEVFERIVKAAEGAALGTGTRMEYELINGVYNLLPNETLTKVLYNNLKAVGGVQYTPEETAYAAQIFSTLNAQQTSIASAATVQPYEVPQERNGAGGSTDVGDISWVVPTTGLGTATWVPGTSAHSWQAVAAGGTGIGLKGMTVAAKALALTAIDLFNNPKTCEAAKAELQQRTGAGFRYESLVGNRKPPLDYRN
jgi:aminobenzoyl-glutamate utilization protein B